MKLAVKLAASVALCLISMISFAKDDEGHTLTALWKTYYSAESADKPKDQLAALEKIKKEARAQNLAWDFYDAGQIYVRVSTYSNWKLREKAQENFRKEIEDFPSPVAYFYMNRSGSRKEMAEFVSKNKSKLLSQYNPEFYTRDYTVTGRVFSDALVPLLKNDYEYALWNLYLSDAVSDELYKYYNGKYPFTAFAEYSAIKDTDRDARNAKLEEYADRYFGKAVALFARQDLLQSYFNELDREKTGTSQAYKSLRAACETFLNDRKAFTGAEKAIADCCYQPESLIETMDSKNIGFKERDGKMEVYLQNLPAVTVTIKKEDKTVWEKKFDNPANSYYIQDTIKFDMPALDDGQYNIYCSNGKVDSESYYSKYTLSVAFRSDASGSAVYVADYITGEPVRTVDLVVVDQKGNIESQFNGLNLNGFTKLPKEIETLLKEPRKYKSVYVAYTDAKGLKHSSEPNRFYPEEQEPLTEQTSLRCNLITDRTAFSPDETVHFKAILYSGSYNLRPCKAGVALTAKLYDAEDKQIDEQKLTTGEFGSVAGDFVLKRGQRNGYYSIMIYEGDRRLTSTSVRVDDFVLPTYEVIWDVKNSYTLPLDNVKVKGTVMSYSGHSLTSAKLSYTLERDWDQIESGTLEIDSDGNFCLDVTPTESSYQYYRIDITIVDATGETKQFQRGFYINEKKEEPKTFIFNEPDPDAIAVNVIAGDKRTWAVVELFGTGKVLLESRMLDFSPKGDAPAQTLVQFDYKDSYPDAVALNVLYFQDGNCHQYSCVRRRPDTRYDLPFKITRFLDTTAPGNTYTFTIKTESGVECAASIFDKSTETVLANRWSPIRPYEVPAPVPYYHTMTGSDRCDNRVYRYAMASRAGGRMLKSAGPMVMNDAVMLEAVEEEAMMTQEMAYDMTSAPTPEPISEGGPEAGYIRENFANTIAWEPFLRSDENGEISLHFTNADKMSTYYVQLFAHDKQLRNAYTRREMVVTLPVKVAIVEPQYLYETDEYVANITMSNNQDTPVPGTAEIIFLAGSDYKTAPVMASKKEKIEVPAKGSATMSFKSGELKADVLGILIKFTCDDAESAGDAVFVAVPVYKAEQTLTEAHSAVLLSGADRDALIAELRSQFVNIPGEAASVREVSILQMLGEAIPEKIETDSENLICLLDSYYANYLLEKMGMGRLNETQKTEVMAKIQSCRKADGGYSWFSDMDSSPILTAQVLERFSQMGLQADEQSVRYLDTQYFATKKRPYWQGAISMNLYAYVRSLYAQVPFRTKDLDKKSVSEFRKNFNKYLVPKGKRGLNGEILAKAFRMKTLQNLLASNDGLNLARDWGVKFFSVSKMNKSLQKDAESLVQYAQEHRCGGYYFPNAVMPWRGLMESELYAHTLLCYLLEDLGFNDIANGIRLWMMLQKETQNWKSDSAYIQALGAVLQAPQEILDTKVVALEGTFSKPFAEIKAAGNGFTVERKYFLGDKELKDGDILSVGDKVRAEYRIWSEENRSFVVLRAPRPALLRPVQQLSGYSWGAYRSVLKASTEYWFDVFPEEKRTVTEEFYVTQQGSFRSPVTEIECLYAVHYRANDAAGTYTLASQ